MAAVAVMHARPTATYFAASSFLHDAEQSNACKVKALLITQVGFDKTRSKYKNYQLSDQSQSHFGPGLEVGVAVRAGCVHEPAAAGPDCFKGVPVCA